MVTLTLDDREALKLLNITSMFVENVEVDDTGEDEFERDCYELARRLADELGEWIASKAVMS